MDGVDSNPARDFYNAVWNRMEQNNIPYTLHWGKINFCLNADRLKQMYGQAAVTSWIDARNDLLDPPTLNVFNSQFMAGSGLDTLHGPIV
jgi:hypothetical protein